ncbi:SGNH/GDSL hydrolase family protein [Bacillus sp. FJAT-27231]|uniref:SGNH/GDSL hydrolase family protein n=1 Tax=Bacillus sp. FJAT-27231 TaxID=1679168 RepID=UPI00069EE158|nr:GDSL-type esterase/lipase family protein [Bacillus sp. FJAT-27231]
MKKRVFFMLITVFLITASFLPTNTEAAGVRYVALGDSLAAGQTPHKEIGASYTDLIALALQRTGQLASFSKQLAFPGYSTGQVLERLGEEEAKDLVRKADLITISAGANDLLPLIKNDSIRGMISYQAIPAAFALNGVRKNYIKIFKEIRNVNEHADIYVMGYYFPYPHVKEEQKSSVAGQLALLNKIIEQEANRAGAHFVPVSNRFGKNARAWIPNPADVHPAPRGYLEMANSFIEEYAPGHPLIPESILSQLPAPVSFSELQKRQPHQPEDKEEKKGPSKKKEKSKITSFDSGKSCKRGEYT